MNRVRKGKQFGPVLLMAVLALFCCCARAVAQTIRDLPPPPPAPTPKPTPTPAPPKDEDFDVIRVSSNLVMVPVSVVDASGQPVRGLQVSDFRLAEEGREQQLAEIGNPDEVPLDITILFDVSSSVSQKGFFAFQQRAAASFLKQVLKPVDRAAVFTITNQPTLVSPLAPAEVAAAKLLTIPPATSSVSTSFYDSVVAAAKYLEENSPARRRRVIAVISDGDDTSSNLLQQTTAEIRANQRVEPTRAAAVENQQFRHRRATLAVQRAVQQTDAAFYSINPGGQSVRLNQISMRAQNAMEAIAQSTGGTAYVPDSEQDLEKVFNEIGAELRGQYLLQYYSNSQAAGAQFRRIAVTLPAHPELRVRARQGYYPKNK
ncbi:MAG TPA: VWA domain-containing protein [Pyrinomonadaceae bacterium]|nr:VWA domain-containing protein [Pyrinomonadaceae bacterium]